MTYDVREAPIDHMRLSKSILEYGPDNNCEKESAHAMDLMHKQWETQLCNMLRIVGVFDSALLQGEEVEFDTEQSVHRPFCVLADSSQRLHDHCKDKSIPRSIAKESL